MGPIARLLLFLLKLCPSVSVQVTPQEPSQDLDEDISDHIDSLDDDGITLWVDYLEHMYELDPSQHHYDNP